MAMIRLLARWLSPRPSPGLTGGRAHLWDTPDRAYWFATFRIVP
jgi:hypothetical protein